MIIFIYGSDTFRSREKLREMIRQFQAKRDQAGLNVVRLSGEALSFDRLRQEVMTRGFLSPKKMIVVERILENADQELLEKILSLVPLLTKQGMGEINDDNVLVFYESDFTPKKKTNVDKIAGKIFTLLKKQKYCFEFIPLTGVKLNVWIASRVKGRGEKISTPAIQELAALVGSNLWQLSNDIDKLTALKQGGEITKEDVEQEIKGNFEANIFALTDAVAFQDKAKALKLLKQELDNGANEIYLLTMITRQFRILLQIKSKLSALARVSAEQIASELKLHPFVVKKSLPAANKYSIEQLKNIYQRLLNIDLAFKTSHPNPELLLDLLIVE